MPKKRDNSNFLFIVGFFVLFIFIIAADWVGKNPFIFWPIAVCLIGGFGYALFRSRMFRDKAWFITKKAASGIYEKFGTVEEEEHPRTPIPRDIKKIVEVRANGRCENPGCPERGDVRCQYHHIDANRDHHSVINVAYLCPNCHNKAHNSINQITVRRWIDDNYHHRKNAVDETRQYIRKQASRRDE
jgi:hypothetical protein